MNRKQPPAGIILLVVLSSLTFFSVLLAAYLVFSNQSRHASFAISARNIHRHNVDGIIDDALMTLIRGTSDGTNPFYGEDLLSDYYGRTSAMSLQVGTGTPPAIANGFISVSLQNGPVIGGGITLPTLSTSEVDNLYAGRLITFTNGNLAGQTFRILQSISTAAGNHDVILESKPELGATLPAGGDGIWMNGVPRSSPGLGFDGTEVSKTVGDVPGYAQPNPAASQPGMTGTPPPTVGFDLPVALQPNNLGNVDKSVLLKDGSDFNEDYDAADFYNWFLSHRDFDNNAVIPSFHRPSVINYILNEIPDWNAATSDEYMNAVASIARATMRPLPLAANQFTPGRTPAVPPDPIDGTIYSLPINGEFTGGNSSFALRLPLLMRNETGPPRLNQLAEALINGPWDVDNNFDGVPDSIWVDLGLPLITAPDGKLLRPLVAPMIEDLSGRLNVNAHSNYALIKQSAGVNQIVADWANVGGVSKPAFRGLGYGPADIAIPSTPADASNLGNLLAARYRNGSINEVVPGRSGADSLGVLTSGWRPAALTAQGVYANSVDPYGRGAYGLSLSGAVVAANDGNTGTLSPTDVGETLGNDPATAFDEPASNEAANHPYELDPSGHLSGDNVFTGSELEAIIRINEFDNDLLPMRLANLIAPMTASEPTLRSAITATSVSDDSPLVATPDSASAYDALRGLLGATLTNDQLNNLVAPELRLAHRLNINRRFGNGVDDNGNGVVDEPREYNVPGRDDDGNGIIDDPDEAVGVETEAFMSYAGNDINDSFEGILPDYIRDDTTRATPRQLLARHLYVLMMVISRDLQNQYPSYGDTLSTPVPVSDSEAYRARRIAQWAVNVVDYRDPDAIMTRFAYDPNPFDGWVIAEDIDGNGMLDPATEVFPNGATSPGDFSPVVWGCEQPDLLFSESYATHDVRVRDTDLDATKKKGTMAPDEDDDMDQVRIPQGSLFLELYCPRRRVLAGVADPNTAGIPRELYDVTTGGGNVDYWLNLERTITTTFDGMNWGTTGGTAAEVPVWRIAISEPHFEALDPANNPDGAGNSPLELRQTLPDTLSFQPELGDPQSLDELNDATASLELNRFVLFTNYATLADLQNAIAPIPDMPQPAGVFFNRTAVNAWVLPEQYLSLAPREITHFGSKVYTAGTGPTSPSDQRFEISTTAGSVGLIQRDAAGTILTPDTDNNILPGLGLALSSFEPTDWINAGTTAPNGIGLNVSEPLPINPGDYYAEPTNQYTLANPDYPLTDAYVELDAAGTAVTGLPLDQPEDMRVDGPIKQLTQALAADPTTVADPMLGSVPNYRTAFLQRLADPTRGFHPTLNPYRTIDQIAIDLTVFSGEDTAANVIDPGNAPSSPPSELEYLTGSRQRTGVGVDGVGTNLLYSYQTNFGLEPDPMDLVTPPLTSATDYFELGTNVATTLNYLNANFGTPVATPIRGRPTTPFAMHPWLNRPFATPHELMLVPACSQGRLLEEFSVIDPANPDPPIYPATSTMTTDPAYATSFLSPFRHLLNFFNSQNIQVAGAADAAEFGTLFDFVGTGPRFRGESNAILPSRIPTVSPLAPLYSAPFNFTEDNQRIGKMNLNTIEAFVAWKGLMQGHMNPAEYSNASSGEQLSYEYFLETRRGYAPPNTIPIPTVLIADSDNPVNYAPNRLDSRFPTQFAGVFRRPTAGKFSMEVRDLGATMLDDSMLLRRRNANAGLLRGAGTLADQEGTGGTTPTETPYFVRSSSENPPITDVYQNRNINPFLKYQTLMRMPNLVSDNSQTFLIRMTVGFFEVDADNTTSLGREYGESMGQTQRHRAMFIIDRSIPVGFKPGQNLNARDTVVFERYYP